MKGNKTIDLTTTVNNAIENVDGITDPIKEVLQRESIYHYMLNPLNYHPDHTRNNGIHWDLTAIEVVQFVRDVYTKYGPDQNNNRILSLEQMEKGILFSLNSIPTPSILEFYNLILVRAFEEKYLASL